MAEVHVAHEVTRMALWATHATSDALLREAVLASYLIHVRGLNEFLLKGRDGRGTRVDDVVAEDYFDGRWSTVVPLLIQPELDDIHRRIAHLSTHRLARNTPGTRFNWAGQDPLDRWARTIHGGLKSFIDDLRNAHPDRATWFEPSITAAGRLLAGERFRAVHGAQITFVKG